MKPILFALATLATAAWGPTSENDALEVGVLIEVTDIKDLERMIEEIDDASVDGVLANLLRGSNNHLDTFNRFIENGGATGLRLSQRRVGPGQARLVWEGGNESVGSRSPPEMRCSKGVWPVATFG